MNSSPPAAPTAQTTPPPTQPPASPTFLESNDGYLVPVDPMDELHCDSCQ